MPYETGNNICPKCGNKAYGKCWYCYYSQAVKNIPTVSTTNQMCKKREELENDLEP